MGKDVKEGVDFTKDDLPDGVTLNTESDPIVIGNRRRSDVFSIINDANHASRRCMKHPLHVKPPKTVKSDDEVTKPGKVLHLVRTGENVMAQYEDIVETHRELYELQMDTWMDAFVHANKNTEKSLVIARKLTIAVLCYGEGTAKEHADRINLGLDHGQNQTGYRVSTEDVRKSITNLKLDDPNNLLRQFIKDRPAKEIAPRAKRWFLPPEFMAISPDKLYALAAPRHDDVSYTLDDLKRDAKDYFVRSGKVDNGGDPISEDLDAGASVNDQIEPDEDSNGHKQARSLKSILMSLSVLDGESVTVRGVSAKFGDRKYKVDITMTRLE